MNSASDASLLSVAGPWIVAQLDVRNARRAAQSGVLAECVQTAASLRERFHSAAADSPALKMLARLDLSETEFAMLLTLALCELRPDVAKRLEEIDASSRLVAARAFVYGDTPAHAAYVESGPNGTLQRLSIIAIDDARGSPQVRVSDRVMRILLGDLSPSIERRGAYGDDLPPQHTMVCPVAVTAVLQDAMQREGALVLVQAPIGTGRRSLFLATGSGGRRRLPLDLRRASADKAAFRRTLCALALEAKLTDGVPLLCNLDALADDKGERLAIVANEFAPLIEGNILVTCGVQRPNVQWDRPVIVIEMGQPTHAQRARLWHEALGCGTEEDAERLANQYPLAPALIVRAAEAANVRAAGRDMEPADIYAGIKTVLDDRLGMFARRLTITQTWDDIVLPADQGDAVVELIARVRGRHKVYEQWGFGVKVGKGLGVSALFSGPPGTGKTMVAGLIAKELGLELYQVDTAKVVSKFIGETEKNLAALFDAAEAGHAILLFDEADSLFGKRTDVKSSNDRFANLETNYLLQRLETFTGICLLTSNHESNMDQAFQRRLSLHLRFELPDVDERALLWKAVLPADAPVAPGVDFLGLARKFAMSGGYIKNAALRAAFIAADQGQPITAAHLERAARVEYEGMGKIAA